MKTKNKNHSRITRAINKYCYFNKYDIDDRKLKCNVKKACSELLQEFAIYMYRRNSSNGTLNDETIRLFGKDWGDGKIPYKDTTIKEKGKQMNTERKPGLYQKYIIRRTDRKPIDPDNKYFVLKYEGEGDEKHIDACRKALRVYAEEVKDFLPELSEELHNILNRLSKDSRFEKLHDIAVKAGMFDNKLTPISPEPPAVTTRDVTDEEIERWSAALTQFDSPDYQYACHCARILGAKYMRDLLTKEKEEGK